jgi:hypothetical protein
VNSARREALPTWIERAVVVEDEMKVQLEKEMLSLDSHFERHNLKSGNFS